MRISDCTLFPSTSFPLVSAISIPPSITSIIVHVSQAIVVDFWFGFTKIIVVVIIARIAANIMEEAIIDGLQSNQAQHPTSLLSPSQDRCFHKSSVHNYLPSQLLSQYFQRSHWSSGSK
jgi:hypothetical protein